jgi:hypothetical protein
LSEDLDLSTAIGAVAAVPAASHLFVKPRGKESCDWVEVLM